MAPKYVQDFHFGGMDQTDLLGGKGANLAEMTNMGIPVPPGFTVTTQACRYYLENDGPPPELSAEVAAALKVMEKEFGKNLGDPKDPMLLAVRSGAKFSMPGMMETVLDIGLNDKSVVGLAAVADDDRFAWDSYRRLMQMFGSTVMDVPRPKFDRILETTQAEKGYKVDLDLQVSDLQGLVAAYKDLIKTETGKEFPQDPVVQLEWAIEAVFRSWNTDRARIYRRREQIPDNLGTAVNVMAMVFGNLGADSGAGVAFTRDPQNGQPGTYGDYLPQSQGEDVVAGIRTPLSLDALDEINPKAHQQLLDVMATLEEHYRDMCDVEFTVQQGRLWMLQTRVGKRTPAAAFLIASQLVDEGRISIDEALMRVNGVQLSQLMFPQFAADAPRDKIAKGVPASPGAAVGEVVFDSPAAAAAAAEGKDVILVRKETNPDDLAGMLASKGILTARGGKTSHAAVVARGMGRTAVCGAETLEVGDGWFKTDAGVVINAGEVISIDGFTGEVFRGAVATTDSLVLRYLQGDIAPESAEADDLVRAVHLLISHADQSRRLGVRANADNPEDAVSARALGASGIGLCRTEHMFLGERRKLIERMILADTDEEREGVYAELLPMQRKDFEGILEAMDGLPVVIRLIDPPLHEFLPEYTALSVKVALADAAGEVDAHDVSVLKAVERMHEQNPMLGLRGVRLGLVMPGLFRLQVRALAEAAVARIKAGGDPQPEVMIPLVDASRELYIARERAASVVSEVIEESGVELIVPIGTMIELPRAALTAGDIARDAEFFSFGTNDLTQTTWGFSRDDAEGVIFPKYFELGVFPVSPFETIDQEGVGQLVKMAVAAGRATRPDLGLGVCGEHGGDPRSVHFFDSVGLDYVSCSPYRLPVARLEAGRSALAAKTVMSDTR
ncbi:MAG: pyruvate, phosphate dikinase [Actinomycetes bacterium]